MVSPWHGENFAESKSMTVTVAPTSEEYYQTSLRDLIASLQSRGGKTVICRNICGRFKDFSPEKLMTEYFDRFPDMFCFLFYHPSTAYWMGASPELLLETRDSKTAYTRALAGTRRAGSSALWSRKNRDEHRFVVDDIINRINCPDKHLAAYAEEAYNFRYGNIEHLCTPIKIVYDGDVVFPTGQILSSIHPTPAVCGYPRKDALRDIEMYERAHRHCYVGSITIQEYCRTISYVILRCVHFDSSNWAVYTGSGITGSSVPRDEWLETTAKAAPLLDILSEYSE